jgi:probable phosphoglycerate mutase
VIYLVRHGETAANRARLALGRADPALTDDGQRQAEALAAYFERVDVARIVSSPLTRTRQTAGAIAAALGLEVESDERLVELDYGDWDVRSFADLPADELARWRRDASFAPPGGESLLAVGERVTACCEELIAGPPVVAVSHVSPIKAAVVWALDADPLLAWRMQLDVASITRVGRRGTTPYLQGFNETAHLR